MFLLGALDLMVGVSNDAVNFTNSAMGSRVASRRIVLAVATIGIIIGAITSSGMMEVARKGLFRPEGFTLTEVLQIFLAVMLTDVILLDLYNTFGLPTSTTVSLVFEILGSAFLLALWKIGNLAGALELINAAGALRIIGGIVLSVILAFFSGLLVQFLFRLIFSFDLQKTHKYFGGFFGGIALTIMLLFLLLSALKSSQIIPENISQFLQKNLFYVLLVSFFVFSLISQLYIYFFKGNVFRIIILIGTASLALAFAGNDLVNFIGVPLASFAAYQNLGPNAQNAQLQAVALSQAVQTPTYMLLAAAIIMSLTLWLSKKAQTVTRTEINLASQTETVETFQANPVARGLVQFILVIWDSFQKIIPSFIKKRIRKRYQISPKKSSFLLREGYAFDLLRASVNIVTASSLIIIGTLNKLPLSTTFVTFMVAMGSSLADRAWGRDNAVFRVSGVLTVIGGWFMTAVVSFITAGLVVTVIYNFGFYSIFFLLPTTFLIILLLGKLHHARQKDYDARLQELAYIQENPQKALEQSVNLIADSLLKAEEILQVISRNFTKGKLQKVGKIRKRLRKLSSFHRISVAQIIQVAKDHFQDRDLLAFYSYTSSLNNAKKVLDNVEKIEENVVEHITLYQSPLNKEEAHDLEKVLQLTKEMIGKIKDLVEKKSAKKDLVRKKWDELTKLRTKIHENQLKRLKSEKAKLKTTVPYLVIVDEFVDLISNLIELYENLSLVIPWLFKK